MPVWHEATRPWVADGRLVVLGLTQEQHPERCRLYAQWRGFEFPILHDPVNLMGSRAVPIVVAIDEFGVVRGTRLDVRVFEAEFLDARFEPPATSDAGHLNPVTAIERLAAAARSGSSLEDWLSHGDALVLWGDAKRLDEAVAAYGRAADIDDSSARARFRLGVAQRMRFESPGRQPNDFRAAAENWTAALERDPNHYIYRRRIEQYGPRLRKPYPFYDWVDEAIAEIRGRGETPVELPTPPAGAEIASPTREFAVESEALAPPDPDGKIDRDRFGWIQVDSAVVPARVAPGQAARVHLTFRPAGTSHWNNEGEPMKVFLEAPEGWQISRPLAVGQTPATPESNESRHFEFEIRVPEGATSGKLDAYALVNVCEESGGQCLFLRKDVQCAVAVKSEQ